MMSYFTDSVLQAPTIGCMLISFIAALVGSFMVLQGKSLIGETLSHTSYPGVILALIIERCFFQIDDGALSTAILSLVGAAATSFLGLYSIRVLERRLHLAPDNALSWTLVVFFGAAMTLLSATQEEYPMLYNGLQAYLFGQAATMTSVHVHILTTIAVVMTLLVVIFFRMIRLHLFDPTFGHMLGLARKKLDALLFFMIVVAVVVGIRAVGVVLMSAMLIIPSISCRQFSNTLTTILVSASILGAISGFLGVVIAHEASSMTSSSVSLPTGPIIVLVAFLFFVCAVARKFIMARKA